jgi:hypothetical protein
MDVSFVDQQDRALGLVVDRPENVLLWSQSSGGIVGVADIEDAAVGRGADHRLHVMGVGGGERNFDDLRSHVAGCAHSRLIAGVRGDEGALRRGERHRCILQRLAGTGVDGDGVRREPKLFSDEPGQFGLAAGGVVAAAGLRDRGDGVEGLRTRPERVLIGVDHHGVGVRARARSAVGPAVGLLQRSPGKVAFGEDGQRGRKSGQPEERAARRSGGKERKGRRHGGLLKAEFLRGGRTTALRLPQI